MEIISRTYNIDEAAALIGCKPWKLRQMCKDKEIPYYRVGNRLRFSDVSLNKWILTAEKQSVIRY